MKISEPDSDIDLQQNINHKLEGFVDEPKNKRRRKNKSDLPNNKASTIEVVNHLGDIFYKKQQKEMCMSIAFLKIVFSV